MIFQTAMTISRFPTVPFILAIISIPLILVGCVNLFEDENPIAPPFIPIDDIIPADTVRVDSTQTDSASIRHDDFTAFHIPTGLLLSPHIDGVWHPQDGHRLYRIDPEIQSASLILTRKPNDMGIQWITAALDGSRFGFTSQDSAGPADVGWSWEPVMYVAFMDGSSIARVAIPSQGIVEAPAFSADGRIAYKISDPAIADEIWVDETRVFSSPYVLAGAPAWGTNGDEVFVPLNPMDPHNRTYKSGIYRINISSGVAEPIVTADSAYFNSGFPVQYFHGLSISNGRILFFAWHTSYVTAWLVNTDGSAARCVSSTTNWNMTSGQLAPGGRYFAYGDPGRNGVYLVDVETAKEEKMIEPYGKFAWIPR